MNSLRDLKKPIRRVPVKEVSEQRHLITLFLPRSDPNRRLIIAQKRSHVKLTTDPNILQLSKPRPQSPKVHLLSLQHSKAD
uniref:Uncharacterized protein n=1 Tax=Manihot esculenta TaxID=3983 RepID=A0A2C9VPC5_MANES